MRPRKLYKSYLREYPSQGTFYIDPNGALQTTNQPTCLKNTPSGWWDNQIQFDRSDHYKGLGRKFSNEVNFYGDGAQIIRELCYRYRGVEQLIELVILKWDPDTDTYYLWYKGLLDLKSKQNTIDGFSVSTAEGGAVQMLKTSENQMFEFPCDGSLKVAMPDGSVIRNVKVKLDGMRVQDTFHYAIPKFTPGDSGDLILPASFVSNDGDNVGIIKGNPSYAQPTGSTYFQGNNYVLGTVAPLSMRITGQITVQSNGSMQNTVFRMYARSNDSAPRGLDGIDHAVGLVDKGGGATDPANQIWFPSNSVVLNGTVTLPFDVTYNVAANENPFILFFNQSSAHPITILGGTYEVTFTSQYQATTCWGIRAYDLWRLLMLNACLISSTTTQRYSFAGISKLLQQYPGLVITSGDAIRASGDPNYRKFYNRTQTNPANPTFQFFNYYYALGPVVKTCISDFFDDMDAHINCSLSNQVLPGDTQESIFLEAKEYVFDSSTVTLELPEVTDVKFTYKEDEFYNTLKVGQPDQKYDEKAGKYEWNSTSWWAAPLRTQSKIKEVLAKYRWDAAGIEYIRANMTQDAKSITYNGSDNAVCGLSSDVTKSSYDQDVASFLATPLGSGDALNGNQKPIPGWAFQGVSLPTLIQTYLRPSNDPAVFIFNQPSGIPGTATFTWKVLPTGQPGDTVTIQIWYNGFLFATRTYTVTTAGQTFSDSITLTESFGQGDCLYAKALTSATCDAFISQFQLQVGTGYFTANLLSLMEIQPGNPGQLIPMALQAGTQFGSSPNLYFGMSYNLPMLIFNEQLSDPNFTIAFQANGIQNGGGGQSFMVNLWLNGQVIGSQTFAGVGSFVNWSTNPANFPALTRDMSFGDMLWITISPTSGMTAEVGNLQQVVGGVTTIVQTTSSLTLTSTQILVYELLRVQYDAISGIPCLLGNLPDGRPITTGPGAPFNIEPFFTPKRQMLQNKNWLAATLYNLAPDKVQFLTHEKNQFLSTTKDGVTISENTNVAVQDFGTPLYYPIWMEFKTRVKVDLARMQSYVANGHVKIPWIGKTLYGFPWSISQKPSVDEPQTWKVLLSPKTNLADLINMSYDGISTRLAKIMANQFSFSKTQPFEFVPYGQTPNPAYQFKHLDTDLFINRVQFWPFKSNYFQKARLSDRFPIQCFTNGLTVVPLNIYSVTSQGNPNLPPLERLVATVNMLPVAGSPLQPPYIQVEATICFQDLGLPEGPVYYISGLNDVGANVNISEPIKPVSNYPVNQPTLFFQYSNSENKQSDVYSTGFQSAFRVDGWIDQFSQEGNFTTFEDQPADLELENAVPYETYVLNIGCADGIPDWVFRKVGRIMMLDTVLIDGKAFTREKDAKWQKKTSDSWPKGWYQLAIRPAFNEDALTFGQDGSLLTNTIVTASIDLSAFGNNPAAGPVIIQVTES